MPRRDQESFDSDLGFNAMQDALELIRKDAMGTFFPLSQAIEIMAELAQITARAISEKKPMYPGFQTVTRAVPEWDEYSMRAVGLTPATVGKRQRRNIYTNAIEWVRDPLQDVRDEHSTIDPATGNTVILMTSNPVYNNRRSNPKSVDVSCSNFFEDLAHTLETFRLNPNPLILKSNHGERQSSPSSEGPVREGTPPNPSKGYWGRKRKTKKHKIYNKPKK